MTLWQSRFSARAAEELMDLSVSIDTDKELAVYDIMASIAHVKGLEKINVLNANEASILIGALNQVKEEILSQTFKFEKTDEDIHTAIERRVTEIAPDVGAKLHTGRSRNDQVVQAFKLYLKHELLEIFELLLSLIYTIISQAEKNIDLEMPGYTHLQRAQPILVSHYLLAHCQAFKRDLIKIINTLKNLNVSVLGAGALAGSSLSLDTDYVAEICGFETSFENSIDAVSDRDFVLETLFVVALCFIHLSRISEEIVIFSTQEFNFITLSDSYTTGSSMLAQKKNPDICELIRGKTGRVIGNLTGFLTTLKGLPLAYNRDLQEDKEPTFDSIKQLKLAVKAMEGLIRTMSFNEASLSKAVSQTASVAIDLTEYLVKKGIAFRVAYREVSSLIRDAYERHVPFEELIKAHPELGEEALIYINKHRSTELKKSKGSTSLDSVKKQLVTLKLSLEELKKQVQSFKIQWI